MNASAPNGSAGKEESSDDEPVGEDHCLPLESVTRSSFASGS
jgi:hypothetical protein